MIINRLTKNKNFPGKCDIFIPGIIHYTFSIFIITILKILKS